MTARYVLRRLAQVVPTLAGILLVTFTLVHVAPGDPVVALAGESGDQAYYAEVRARYGLDRPLPEQLLAYVGNVLQADLGRSIVQGRPVADVIGERVPATLLLTGTALLLSTLCGVLLGTAAASRAHGAVDLTLTVAALVGHATPAFWLAQVALLTLAAGAGLFPIQGMTDPRGTATGVARLFDVAHHLALPAAVLAATEAALVTRLVRGGLLQELGREYLRLARAKGVAPGRVLRRHALPNALLPVVTVVGGRVGFLLSGAVLVEVVFAWPGLGRLLLASAQARDYPVLLGLVLLVAFAVVIANLLTDLAYARIDPRIRYS